MWYALPVNTFWVIDLFYLVLFYLVLKISNRFYIWGKRHLCQLYNNLDPIYRREYEQTRFPSVVLLFFVIF